MMDRTPLRHAVASDSIGTNRTVTVPYSTQTCRLGHLLALAIAVVMISSPGHAQTSASGRRPPNILFIMTDDHAARTISAYGSGINQTPNIDRVADEGAIFTNSFVVNSICGPSRASVLTGKYSHKHGITGNGKPWDNSQMVFPRLLKAAGYRTALIGKWHYDNRPADEYDDYKILVGAGNQGFYYNPAFYSSDKGLETMPGYSTDLITDEALRWLKESRHADKPFLLLVQYKAPHVPRMPPLRLLDKYIVDTIAEPPTLHDDLSTRSYYAKQVYFFLDRLNPLPPYGTYDPKKKSIYLARMTDDQLRAYHAVIDPQNQAYRRMLDKGMLDDATTMRRYVYQRMIKDYLRLVEAIDENVGRLLDWLDGDDALKNNTVVVYASDQGYFTGEHGYAEKRLMYEEAMRFPLLMRWPGKIKAGTRVESLVQNIDFAPTFMEIAGVPAPKEVQGRSLLPLLDGEPPAAWRTSVYYQYFDHMWHGVGRHAGVRTDRYKLIHFYTDDVWEFYDLQQDPLEVNNVYGKLQYASEIMALKKEYDRLKREFDVPQKVFEAPFELD